MLETIEMISVLGQKLQDAIEAAAAREAMEAWEQTTQPTEPMTTPNITVSEATFNAVRDNPGQTKMQIALKMAALGYKKDTATSMVNIMLRYGIIREENGVLFAVGDKYRSRVDFNRGLSKKRKVTKKGEERKEIRLIRRPAPAEEAPVKASDPINSPAYYKVGGIETIDFIQAKLTPEEFKGYLLGNVLKYASRAGHKDNAVQDAGKLAWYANKLAGLA